MTSWTPPRTWAAGQTVDASALNTDLRDDLNYLYTQVITAPPYHIARAYRNTNLSVPDSARTLVTLPTGEDIDTDGFHDLVTNSSRFTLPAALVPAGYTAVMMIAGYVTWAANAAGYRELRILRNGGSSPENTVPAVSGATMGQHISLVQTGVLNDYWEMDAYQTSGGAINITGAALSVYVVGIQPT